MKFLAFDLGAESGRAILGSLDSGRLTLDELHRFPNQPVRLPTGLYWDTLRLFHEIQQGLIVCGRDRRITPNGIGVDTWGVDFGLLGSDGALVDNPRHYRDARTQGLLERTYSVVPREEIFRQTGLQFMEFNSLFQWYSMKLAGAPALTTARTLLFLPDLFSYWLSGAARAELTIASTSQFYNPIEKTWAKPLLASLGLDSSILPEIVPPGTRLGALLEYLHPTAGFSSEVPVYTTASHDTASAVAAAPAEGSGWCYISSGTWSLLGVEIDSPIINADSLALNFTNEIGAAGRVRFLKNIAGLWILQECRRAWALEGRQYSYEELTQLAAAAPPAPIYLNPDDFTSPGDMPARIARFCRSSGVPAPVEPGPMARLVLESLAVSYRDKILSLEKLLGRPIHRIHIFGGGSRNRLLNQLTADYANKPVIAGPAEATAAGNVLVQAMGAGAVKDLDEARAIVRASFPLERFEPRPGSAR
jgi:rhamnulokinase